MRYTDPLGFSFDLPDGWRHDERVTPVTFFGPTGDIGRQVEVIQLKVDILHILLDRDYTQPEAREAPSFWGEQQADTFRSNLGSETNVVVLKRTQNNEISCIHDGVHYSITYSIDTVTVEAMKALCATFIFPPAEEAQRFVEWKQNQQLENVRGQTQAALRKRAAEIEAQRAPKDTAEAIGNSGVGCAVVVAVFFALWALFQKSCR
jgi:hypothetical protein